MSKVKPSGKYLGQNLYTCKIVDHNWNNVPADQAYIIIQSPTGKQIIIRGKGTNLKQKIGAYAHDVLMKVVYMSTAKEIELTKTQMKALLNASKI